MWNDPVIHGDVTKPTFPGNVGNDFLSPADMALGSV